MTRKKTSKASKKTTRSSSAKASTTKKASKKTTAKAGTKTATKTAAKAKTKTKAKVQAKTVVKATKKKAVAKSAASVKKKAAAKKKGPVPLDEVPTEELWGLYRKAVKSKKSDKAERLEELRNILMERHYPLVRYIAERLLQTLPKSIELDDLISAGLFGLMDAIRGFDPDRGIKFKTYCTTRIRGSILDQLRSQDWVPRLVRLKAGKIDKALQRLTGEYGREPTHAELAAKLEMEHSELSLEMSQANAKTMFSLSEKWEDRDDDSSVEKVDVLEDRKASDPIGELHRRDLMNFVTRSLTHKERFIIEQYYQVGHTMREIGEMLALTESRVCQIHSNVMGRLKGLLGQKTGTLLT